MTQTQTSKRFLTVGSFLRPEDLLAYKRQIEERDDIQYPFYQDFDNYEKVEDEAVADIVKKEIELDFPEIEFLRIETVPKSKTPKRISIKLASNTLFWESIFF